MNKTIQNFLLTVIIVLAIATLGSCPTKSSAISYEKIPSLAEIAVSLQGYPADYTGPRVNIGQLLDEVHLNDKQIQLLDMASRDMSLALAERCAAMVLLSTAADPARTQTILELFNTANSKACAFHVMSFGAYLGALSSSVEGGLPVFRAENVFPSGVRTRYIVPPVNGSNKPSNLVQVTAEEIPLLARFALVPSFNSARRYQARILRSNLGLAQLLLGKLDDSRAVDILLFAPLAFLGDRYPGNPKFYSLKALCQKEHNRDRILLWMKENQIPNERCPEVILALAANRDERVLSAFIELIHTQTKQPMTGNDGSAVLPPRNNLLIAGVNIREVLGIAAAWHDPRLLPVLKEYLYTRGIGISEAATAIRACGGELEKDKLWPLLDCLTDTWELSKLFNDFLKPMLTQQDTAKIASLLERSNWNREDFMIRVRFIQNLQQELLTPTIEEALITIAEEHPKDYIGVYAVEALERFPDPALLPLFRHLLESNEGKSDVAVNSLRILIERSKSPERDFLNAFDDDNNRVRLAAASLLINKMENFNGYGLITDKNRDAFLAKTLERIKNEPVNTIRAHTINALYWMLCRGIIVTNEEALRRGRMEALPILAPFCGKDTDSEVASAIISCLLAIGNTEAARLLDRFATKHTNQSVRERAARVAKEIRSDNAKPK